MADSWFERALSDVSKVFAAPPSIIAADDLADRQKIDLLKQWETDLRLLMVAGEANMTGPRSDGTGDLLSTVRRCLEHMGVPYDEEHQAPNKAGGAYQTNYGRAPVEGTRLCFRVFLVCR